MAVRVLIVDDNEVIRDGLRSILVIHDDITVVGEAVHGRDALDKVTQLDPDVILMDAQMPCMDGIEATRTIKQRDPVRQILFLTVYSSYAADAQAAGADAFLLKDCGREALVAAVRQLGQSGAQLLERTA